MKVFLLQVLSEKRHLYLSFHVAGPLTLDPKTKSAAAEELENRMSSVVVSETTFPSVKLVDSVIVNFSA